MQEVGEEIETVIISTGYLDNAPFKWIGLSLRYGLKYGTAPIYQGINKKYGDLSIAIELDTHDLRIADRGQLKRLYMIATLTALIHVARKYNLPCEKLIELKNEIINKQED
jgi:hypothetical protein